MKETFNCVTLSRADFESRGFDTTNIDDTTMANIAMKIGDSLVESLYWDLIDEYGSNNSMPPTPAAAFQDQIAPIIPNGLPLNTENGEVIYLSDKCIVRRTENGRAIAQTFDAMDAEEIGYIRNLLKKQGYLGGCESDNNNDAPSAEPEEKPEEGQFPLTICDTGDGEECFVTFENGDEMIEYFNDEFAAARGEEFKTIADCMEWIDESYYLSVVSEKEYEVTLSYHQSVIVKTKGYTEKDAIANAYAADFDNPEVCTQLGWEEDGDQSAEEI